ncbi:MAG: hypothetical protein NZ526_08310, partial [Aquificaceae bacterium]|nr:hypothetical protein [Aquificaceae bacterium]
MVAPAPVSALLHAVAVVKTGAFGVFRLIYNLYGVDLVQSMNLKKRLAYSTISHLSYIFLGILIPSQIATMGGLLHLVNHGIMKITLFMCVGNYSQAYGAHKVREVAGMGRLMPITTLSLTLASLGLSGIPLTAGYLSKKYLEEGAKMAGVEWALYLLMVIPPFITAFLTLIFGVFQHQKL